VKRIIHKARLAKKRIVNYLLLYLSDCDGMCNHCDIKKECDERKHS